MTFVFVLVQACGHSNGKAPKGGKIASGSEKAFYEKMIILIGPADTSQAYYIKPLAFELKKAYRLNDYYPMWLSPDFSANSSAESFLKELQDVKWDGLEVEKYHLSELVQLRKRIIGNGTKLEDALSFDTMLTKTYLAVAKDLLLGELVPRKADPTWYHANDSVWEVARALADMDSAYFPLNKFRSTLPTYQLLREEYKWYASLCPDSGLVRDISAIHNFRDPDSLSGVLAAQIIRKELPWFTPNIKDSMPVEAQWVANFQYYHGLEPTGELDSTTLKRVAMRPDSIMKKLSANMERIRWMQRNFGELYVLVDIPLMELFLRNKGGDSMHMRVVVGKPVRPTPTLDAVMANVVINPPWGVPPTILKKDVMPGVEKSGSKYLAKKGLKVYNRDGKAVSGSVVTSKNYKRYIYRQDPGNGNALGFVKFNLPNPWDIYLHDTPHRTDFAKRYRALSSGCIRLQHPQEMAIYILSQIEKKDYNQEKLSTMIKTHHTKWEVMKTKIPVHISYMTAFEDSTSKHVRMLNDVYGKDDKLMSLLSAR